MARGERTSQVYVIMERTLHAVLYAPNGRQVSLRELTDGDVFGELAAIDSQDRCANILAIRDARLIAFDRTDFLSAIHFSPEAVDWLLGQIRSSN